MSRIIYEHSDGHQSKIEIDPELITRSQLLGINVLREVFAVLEAEIQADAKQSTTRDQND